MNQIDQNINKDMIDSELIDVDSLDFADDQTWLFRIPSDSGNKVDIVDWKLSCDWPINEDDVYLRTETELYSLLDNILKNEVANPDKHKFDSRTYVRPKKRMSRPSINSMEFGGSKLATIHQNVSTNNSTNKYLTYNKYNNPTPMLRLKTFNVDTNSDNSTVVKDYALKRRSLVHDDDMQLEDIDVTPVSNSSTKMSLEPTEHSKPINIDLSQPAHNLHNTFNKGLTNVMNERSSLTMYCSGDSLMRMSPPSLVSSMNMEGSGTFNPESLESRQSLDINKLKDSGLPSLGRESIDPMMTSMTLSILDEKDMSTSFLSQTTYPDNDSLMDSLPPSLVNSINSSFVVPKSKNDSLTESNSSNVFSSDTFTHLQKSEKLLKSRPSLNPYNNVTKRESGLRMLEGFVKSREETAQVNAVTKDSPTQKISPEMGETITLNFSSKFRKDAMAEKENLNSSFEKDNTFYMDMSLQKPVDMGKNSLNVTMDKQELNEIIQARQKLSLARKALPTEENPNLPNQADTSPVRTIQLPNQTITVPKHSIENAPELLARRRALNSNNLNKEDAKETTVSRDTPKRNATFKKPSPKANSMDTTVVYLKQEEKIIDINSATMNLIGSSESTLQQEEWGSQERAMVGSSESTDTSTFSSSSPPESVPEAAHAHDPRMSVASTPLAALKNSSKNDPLNLHNTISPIYDLDQTHKIKTSEDRTFDMNTTVVNSATILKKTWVKRDILANKGSPEKKAIPSGLPNPTMRVSPPRLSPTRQVTTHLMIPPTTLNVPRRTGLPTSKLRQYSSHRELNRIPAASGIPPRMAGGSRGGMTRRGVYASNPALSPPSSVAPPIRRDSYTVLQTEEPEKPVAKAAPAPAPTPALVRQGTETLRRERPQSQLVAPRDLRVGPGVMAVPTGVPVPYSRSSHHMQAPSTTRPSSIAGASQLRVSRPASATVSVQRSQVMAPPPEPSRPLSGLPRPSRLPGPSVQRRMIRPPSVYSVAPTADFDHY